MCGVVESFTKMRNAPREMLSTVSRSTKVKRFDCCYGRFPASADVDWTEKIPSLITACFRVLYLCVTRVFNGFDGQMPTCYRGFISLGVMLLHRCAKHVDSSWILMAAEGRNVGFLYPQQNLFSDEIEFDKNKVDSVARQCSGLLLWVL